MLVCVDVIVVLKTVVVVLVCVELSSSVWVEVCVELEWVDVDWCSSLRGDAEVCVPLALAEKAKTPAFTKSTKVTATAAVRPAALRTNFNLYRKTIG